MRLVRGAPVRMTEEGVGEISDLADALSLFGVRCCVRARAGKIFGARLVGR